MTTDDEIRSDRDSIVEIAESILDIPEFDEPRFVPFAVKVADQIMSSQWGRDVRDLMYAADHEHAYYTTSRSTMCDVAAAISGTGRGSSTGAAVSTASTITRTSTHRMRCGLHGCVETTAPDGGRGRRTWTSGPTRSAPRCSTGCPQAY
nr:hypothetical protein ISGA_39 [Gordonia sp. NB41Y]